MSSLHAVAHGNALNIGTADHVIASMDPDAIRPGELINWIKRFDTADLDDKIAKLSELTEPLQNTADNSDDSMIENFRETWKGEGGRAFQKRWGALIKYIADEPLGRLPLLTQQINAMTQLRSDIQAMYDGCRDDIGEHLGGFREAYAKALCQNTDSTVVGSIFASAGAGAGIGSMFGVPGSAVGGTIGAVVGLVTGFQSANEDRIKTVLEKASEVQGLLAERESAGSSLELSDIGDDGMSLDSHPFEPDDDLVAGGWDEAMNGGWEPK